MAYMWPCMVFYGKILIWLDLNRLFSRSYSRSRKDSTTHLFLKTIMVQGSTAARHCTYVSKSHLHLSRWHEHRNFVLSRYMADVKLTNVHFCIENECQFSKLCCNVSLLSNEISEGLLRFDELANTQKNSYKQCLVTTYVLKFTK